MAKILHIVWSPATGPIDAYWNASLAYGHARAMLGVDVTSLKVRERLPSVVLDDLGHDFEEDDDTPVEVPARIDETDTVVIDFEDIDDEEID